MALNYPITYQQNRVSTNKPTWTWPEVFKGIVPLGTDIDFFTEYNGHFLFVEQKAVSAPMSITQEKRLTSLAAQRNTWVLLVGTKHSLAPDYARCWDVAYWKWIGQHAWTNTRFNRIGGTCDLGAELTMWTKHINELEGHKSKYMECMNRLQNICFSEPGLI